MKLDELQTKRQDLKKELTELDREIENEIQNLITERTGIKKDIVVINDGKEFLVSKICHYENAEIAYLKAFPKKKDGTWSGKDQYVWSGWELK